MPNRRGFLHRAAVGTCAALTTGLRLAPNDDDTLRAADGAPKSEPVAGGEGIVDTHTHFYDPTRPEGVPWPSPNSGTLYRKVLPEEFVKLAGPLGVTATVVVEASPWLEDNQWLLDLADRAPVVIGVVGNLAPGRPEFAAELARFAKHPKFRGIRLRTKDLSDRLDDAAYAEDLSRMADRGLTIDVLGGPDVLPTVARWAEKVPKLTFVLDHLPYDLPADPARRAALEKSLKGAAAPNVFAKISYVLKKRGGRTNVDPAAHKDVLDAVWEAFGPRHVLYGSNWPVSDHDAPYADVLNVVRADVAARGAEARDAYFRRNAERAYGVRGGLAGPRP